VESLYFGHCSVNHHYHAELVAEFDGQAAGRFISAHPHCHRRA
jgi:hypothetical protein